MDTKRLSPAVRQLISASQKVVEKHYDDNYNQDDVDAAIRELKHSLGSLAAGDTRQPHAQDRRQKGPI